MMDITGSKNGIVASKSLAMIAAIVVNSSSSKCSITVHCRMWNTGTEDKMKSTVATKLKVE
jgi:hypothetical protein